ncbi:PAS domain S-box-containing protein/diguanylate cyclase (GGDEF) domain-containing protein [Abditibacterium utsteinense]|uniref:PAS domain S-box-containing protein/diguanylate cyclase (GGDEF) domain-containing protein n=1 Tax=Abditibacterium utsteinense TaxID=1960156 RepID=A0A2S8SV82_9BACT|nr:EAL domain-containing protein [Abditibacterium utsteinense]PQV64718.1 PAS domain S-box-containing protein/diguanylate cyclase (GGDEF) domain-containing protein [Abditibacterium utsteinense]
MTLRVKTLLTVGTALGALLVVLYLALRPLVLREFSRAESDVAIRRLQRTREVWNYGQNEFASNFIGWAAWNDMYDFVSNNNAEFRVAELNDQSLSASRADFVGIVRNDGTVLFARLFANKSTRGSSTIPPSLSRYLKVGSPYLRHENAVDIQAGLLVLPSGPMMVASLPVTTSNRAAPVSGTLLIGRYMLHLDWMRYIEATDQATEFRAFSSDLPANFAAAAAHLGKGEPFFLQPENGGEMAGYFVINDLGGAPLGLIRVGSPMEIMPRANLTLSYFTLLMLGCGVLLLILALLPVEKLVLARVARLNSVVDAVRTSGDLTQRVEEHGGDELSQLGANINRTLAALQAIATRQKRSERLYQQMAETALSAGDAYFVWQAGQEFLDWHGDIDALLGYAPGGMKRTQKAWLQHIHSVDQGKVVRSCARGLALKQVVRVEFRVIRCDGTTRHWMIRGKPLASEKLASEEQGSIQTASLDDSAPLGSSGAPRLLAVCIDITARKLAEEALRQSEERLQRIFDTAADAIVIADNDGQITFANEAAARIFGLSREEITARTIDDKAWEYAALDGGPFDPSENPFSRVRATGDPVYEVQYGVASADGPRVIVSVNAAPLLDARGNFSGMVASFADVTERRTLEARLQYQAFHDALTGLANRSLLRDRLEHALIQRGNGDNPIAVLFIDLDNFKYINDSLGHAAGDELIVEIGRRLKVSLRAGDTAARFGGDEFVVLLESVDSPHYVIQVAERLLDSLREPFNLSGREVFTTPSIGIAFSTGQYDHPDELLRHADAAMYEAKRLGKARYEVFQSSMSTSALNRLEIENDLRRALQKNEFFLHFQSKWNLETHELCGFEALVRWQHPQRGLVSPGDFIPIAEETGLIVPLGFMVLKSACEQAKLWSADLEKPIFMAVNVSARQLQLPEIVPLVARVIKESGFSPSCLILEITESSIVERTGAMLDTLNSLKALGVKLAIDDFGTGYSSLAYLRAFPFDYLKIDRQFVTNVHEEGGNGVIISSMITLAHALGLRVIAEGAEQIEEVAHLRHLGCDMAQGYYFGRPMNTAETEARFELVSCQAVALESAFQRSIL